MELSMVKRKNQSKHDEIVKSLAVLIEEDGHTDIKADIGGYERPTKIIWKNTGKGHIPDVISTKTSNYIFEVETDDSIDDSHTADQWVLFSKYAKRHNTMFIVVVPEGSKQDSLNRAIELDIELDAVWEF